MPVAHLQVPTCHKGLKSVQCFRVLCVTDKQSVDRWWYDELQGCALFIDRPCCTFYCISVSFTKAYVLNTVQFSVVMYT